MKTGAALLAIAACAGVGYFIGKKIIENQEKNASSEAYTQVKETNCGDKVRRELSRLRTAIW